MALQQKGMHGAWVSRWTFIMAATGSAVGLGNMWKFPYVAGSNGGGAFVLVYLACILLIGVPVMMAEVMLGRHERKANQCHTRYCLRRRVNRHWSYIGWLGVIAAILILSFYAVIAGWALSYIIEMGSGVLKGADGEATAAAFTQLLNNPAKLILWQTIFLTLCVAVVMGGVKKGLGVAVETLLMPILFFIL